MLRFVWSHWFDNLNNAIDRFPIRTTTTAHPYWLYATVSMHPTVQRCTQSWCYLKYTIKLTTLSFFRAGFFAIRHITESKKLHKEKSKKTMKKKRNYKWSINILRCTFRFLSIVLSFKRIELTLNLDYLRDSILLWKYRCCYIVLVLFQCDWHMGNFATVFLNHLSSAI